MLRAFLLFLLAIVALVSCAAAQAAAIPRQALPLLPVLVRVQHQAWPDAPTPWFLAGQVEQESCITLAHPKCWNTGAQLKTSREYGFGLGQITIAYRADGSVRFNKWAELRTRYPQLRAWSWDQRLQPDYQLTALVVMDRGLCTAPTLADAATDGDRLGFCLSAYNGGEGGLAQDRTLCFHTPGCDRRRWWGHVELHSMKTRVPNKGYGHSAYEINREYPRLILRVRADKYQDSFSGSTP